MDRHTLKQRSYNMSRIRSKNTKLEVKLFDILEGSGTIFRKHAKDLPGTPDIVFDKDKLAIFVDSDFWHGWRFEKWKKRLPDSYWLDKIAQNIKRDKKNRRKLKRHGWKVVRIWEHQLIADEKKVINKLLPDVQEQ